ncbi:sodium channel protein Nach [Sabethes cyaneus]|uniref:sodium channel protein Nach n=1 Tax=Sabethes cyaneus TaxID=53552 RepID=UPI00237E3844|nr:sodium channel protein Nach [Sabethes cyaneus]
MSYILLYTLDSFQETVNIHIDTSYLRWNNTFPAISICYTKGRSINSIGKFFEKYWKENNISKPAKASNYFRLAQSYLFVSPNSNIDLRGSVCTGMNRTCDMNWDTMQKMFFPHACNEIFVDVKFLNTSVQCDKIFKLLQTEMGPCFVANSIYSYEISYENLPLKYAITTKERTIDFMYKEIDTVSFILYVHSPEELPHPLMPSYRLRKSGVYMHYSLNTIEVLNYPDIEKKQIYQRECRFPFENIAPFLAYSFTNCFFHKRIQLELEICNCTLPTSPTYYKTKYCDLAGLICVSQANVLSRTKKYLFEDKQPCIQSCFEMEINIVGENTINTEDSDMGFVRLEVMSFPSSRYERRVSHTDLDFIVSLGGVGGLFFGISLLTVFEFIYYCLRK